MGLINSFASWLLKKRMYQMELFMRHPHETQQEVFHRLISGGKETLWGKLHGYGSIQHVRQFQEQVPIQGYEQAFPWIERTLKGERDVLWPGEVLWFSKSSGTTNNRSKFIPVTQDSLDECHFKAGKDMISMYLHHHPESQLFTGKCLPISGSHQVNQENPRAFFGDLSAVLIENTPFPFDFFRATSKRTALLGDWEGKLAKMVEELPQSNVTSIVGVPTWTLVLLQKLQETLGRSVGEILPNLEVFFHGGVSFKPYRPQFQRLIPGDRMAYFETYNASEGFFGIQLARDKEDLLLMLDYGIFYEFIPLGEMDREHPQTVLLHEVELGQEYAVVISTNGGLWRYALGDTVRVTGTDPYCVVVSGRTKQYINAFGEELMVDNAETALSEACKRTGALIANFTAAPMFFEETQGGSHEWLIEFDREPGDMELFGEILDTALKSLNSDYEAKRFRNIALRAPHIRSLPPGSFYAWMKARGRLGGQNKVPRLCNTREHVDSILQFLS